jgi:hypothetical protein
MKKLWIGLTMVCLTLCLYLVAQAKVDPSLVLYLDFEDGKGDTVKDLSNYGNDGTIQGEPKWVDGKFGKGLEIGIGSIVLVPDSDKFKITDELTVACWAKFEDFAPEAWQGNTLDFLVCRWNWDGGDNRCYETYLESHAPTIVVSSDGTDATSSKAVAQNPVELEQWYNIVGTFDGSKLKIYVNGEEAGTGEHKGKIFAGDNSPISIGDNNAGLAPDFHFVGVIDEVAVYDRALSQSEIKQKVMSGNILAVRTKGKLTTTWGGIKDRD